MLNGLADLTTITPAERLYLWRLAQGATQPRAARRLRVSRRRYSTVELGRAPVPPTWAAKAKAPGKPSIAGLLRLARRRSRLELRPCAALAGVSHVLYLRLEVEGSPRLVAFWEGRGFIFPGTGPK